MRLLTDNDLSPKLVTQLSDLYPNSLHIKDIGPENALDADIWAYARERGLVIVTLMIVTKDQGYRELSMAKGHPPKVILVERWNGPTARVAASLRDRYADIRAFIQDDGAALLSFD